MGEGKTEDCSYTEETEVHNPLEQSYTSKPRIQEAIESIFSLISLTHSIRVFSVKWQSIRYKLDELLTNLSAIENCESSDHFSLHIAIDSILATLSDCHDLVRKCVELSYTGKLRMQSDLDMVCNKLENNIKGLSEVYSLGLLTQSYALVVSRPNVSASRDDLRFYINDLVSRFKIGNRDMKKQALIEFNEVVEQDERCVKIAVEVDSLLTFLVNFLDSQDADIQGEASKAVSLMAGFQNSRSVLIGNGVIPPLIRVIECGSELSIEFATRGLQKLTENSDNAWSVSAHGGVTALLKQLSDENGNELVVLACGVLKNLIGVEEIKRFMIEEGAIQLFLKLAQSKDEATQISSLDFLQSMAYGDESIREIIIKAGGICALIRVLDPKASYSSKAREVALRGIMNLLCFSSENVLNLLMSYNFLDHIFYFLNYSEVLVQESALKAAFWLCGTSEEAKKVMGDKGFMPVIVKFLDSKSFEVREMAAETLSSMLIIPRNRKRFVQNDQNIGLLLQMLDPGAMNAGNKKLLLSILMNLTSCSSARKKIVSSGYLKYIQKLAEDEVSDAKKIVRKLSSNKFRNIFSGIWHS